MRIIRMREMDLDLFDFDYDLTWMAFFLEADDRILGRYGGRDSESAESRNSIEGLRYAMTRALALHRTGKAPPAPKRRTPARTVQDYPGIKRLGAKACVHCHQVYDLRREALQANGKWTLDELWVYPQPENIGIRLDLHEGDKVAEVIPRSEAERVGVKKGDRLLNADGHRIASFADLQYALHRAPTTGNLKLSWERNGKQYTAMITLKSRWRKTDISWRWSLRGVDPPPWVHGPDLDKASRKELGLKPTQLALEQGPFVSQPARQAGIQQGDIILGVNGKILQMTAQQFGAYIRLHYQAGDRVKYHLLRQGKRIDVEITLRGRSALR